MVTLCASGSAGTFKCASHMTALLYDMTAADEWEGFCLQELGYDSTHRGKLKFLLLGLPWPACRRYVQGDDDDDEVRATLNALLRQLQGAFMQIRIC